MPIMSEPSTDTPLPARHPSPWVRSVVGDGLSSRTELRGLSLRGHASLMWWALGITPTARRRRALFRESIADTRGVRFAFNRARSYAKI